MNTKKIILYSLIFCVLFLGIFNISSSYYSTDLTFKNEVENQLKSSVDMKKQGIVDYFEESILDVENFADLNYTKGFFLNAKVQKESVVDSNINKKLEILAKQIKIYISGHPDKSLEDFLKYEDFLYLLNFKFGERGRIFLYDIDTKKNLYGISGDEVLRKEIGVKTSDGINLGMGVVYDYGDYVFLEDLNEEEIGFIENSLLFLDYENVIFISDENIIYSYLDRDDLGLSVFLNNNSLSKIYSETLKYNSSMSFGPIKDVGNENLFVYFSSPVYDGNNLLGVLIFVDSFDFVENIVLIDSLKGDSYILNENGFLVTQYKDYTPLVQQIQSVAFSSCFQGSYDDFLEYRNFEGKEVLGVYSKVNRFNWCLISEFLKDDLLKIPKEKSFKKDLIFNFGMIVVLLCFIFLFENNFSYNFSYRKTRDFSSYGLGFLFFCFVSLIFVEYLILKNNIFSLNKILLNLVLFSLFFVLFRARKIKNDIQRISISFGVIILSLVSFAFLIINKEIFSGFVNLILLILGFYGILLTFYGIKFGENKR